PAPTFISPLSLHDALPIFREDVSIFVRSRQFATFRFHRGQSVKKPFVMLARRFGHLLLFHLFDNELWIHYEALGTGFRQLCVIQDRKSTRLNSSHVKISYA